MLTTFAWTSLDRGGSPVGSGAGAGFQKGAMGESWRGRSLKERSEEWIMVAIRFADTCGRAISSSSVERLESSQPCRATWVDSGILLQSDSNALSPVFAKLGAQPGTKTVEKTRWTKEGLHRTYNASVWA